MTAAETALVDAYTAQIGELPGEGAVLSARDTLLADLRKQGLPTRRVESWHYTDLRALLQQRSGCRSDRIRASAVDPLVAGSSVLSVLNGKADPKGAPTGVNVRSYAESLVDGVAAADLD